MDVLGCEEGLWGCGVAGWQGVFEGPGTPLVVGAGQWDPRWAGWRPLSELAVKTERESAWI